MAPIAHRSWSAAADPMAGGGIFAEMALRQVAGGDEGRQDEQDVPPGVVGLVGMGDVGNGLFAIRRGAVLDK